MKLRSPLMFAALLACAATASAQTVVCTPEEALKKAEETAVTINRIAAGNPEKAARLHEQLKALQERDPTRSHHGACEAYDRIIHELEEKNAAGGI
ncbi:hypothetical protein [Pseudomonas sp. MYb185]|uniref:hypothetical protein n=1 Tax=Pseudomonas sp. MYb185 TaxID=1848729 RepID=UPI000CFB213D|nr:hypothetical protein [Pseudomonas sp. MYb185]PRB80584.1 hypothetical protein CQ007_12770 [Pseudomonas sp. MYb185]